MTGHRASLLRLIRSTQTPAQRDANAAKRRTKWWHRAATHGELLPPPSPWAVRIIEEHLP